MTELTLRYQGDESANVEVYTKKDQLLLFAGTVDADGTFTFIGDDKKGIMGTEIYVLVDGELNVKIHMSCSQPIAIGMEFGDFEIVDVYSRNSGRIWPYEN